MNDQNEDHSSRRKFLTATGLAGAAAVAAAARPVAAKVAPIETEFSPDQISKLEDIVKNFITNAKETDPQQSGITLAAMKGHGSHYNENAARGLRSAPTKK